MNEFQLVEVFREKFGESHKGGIHDVREYLDSELLSSLDTVSGIIEAAGMEWERSHSMLLPALNELKVRVPTYSVRKLPVERQPSGFWWAVDEYPKWPRARALMQAAINCARERSEPEEQSR